eukprot:jgi/Chlat1/9252/Chrsp99S08524
MGLVRPRLPGSEAILVAVSLVGAVAMPHNLLSADLAAEDCERCADLSLNNAFFLLGATLGAASQKLYSVALLASGQSSSVTGTCAGQHVMSVILSFQLPFALLPLVKVVSSEANMGPLKKKKALTIFAFCLTAATFCANSMLLRSFLVDVRHSHSMSRVAKEFITVIEAMLVACYIASLLYLAIMKDRKATFPGLDTALEDVAQGEGEDRTTAGNGVEVAVVWPCAMPPEDAAIIAASQSADTRDADDESESTVDEKVVVNRRLQLHVLRVEVVPR